MPHFLMPRTGTLLLLVLALASVASVASVASTAAEATAKQDAHDLALTDHYHDADDELSDDDDDVVVRCRSCGGPIAFKDDFIDLHDTSKAVGSRHEAVLGDNVQLFTFVNPSRVEYELAGFKEVVGLEGKTVSKKATFFEGYSWREIRCDSCNRHIGWKFYHDELQQCINMQLAESTTTKKPHSNYLDFTTETDKRAEIVRKELEGHCVVSTMGWWTYEVCYGREVRQYHQESDGSRPSDWSMGLFVPKAHGLDAAFGSTDVIQYFAGGQHCDENGELRSTKVLYTCCKSRPKEVTLDGVDEPDLCRYIIRVCVPSLCETKANEEQDSDKDEQITTSCHEKFDAAHAHDQLPSSFTTLRWSTVISEDSSELDWARRMQFAT